MYKTQTLSLLSAITIGFISLVGEATAATEIDDLKDLKKIQTKINKVVKSVLPATVSLNSLEIGAAGSGVIVSKDGLILTAAHVIEGSDEMLVIFPDGKQVNAKVLGANFTRDSAMMQITDTPPAGGWPYAEVGDPKNITIGDLVIAMGHPGGYDADRTPPVRFGRFISHSLDHFYNTDCTIIAGDSGGPLFDLEGKVIGIHSSIGQSLNANNHASITGFRQDWEKLLSGKKWGVLGRSGLMDENAPVLGILTERISNNGLLVVQVVPHGPADKAGLKEGDLIQQINDRKTTSLESLQIELSQEKPGNSVQLVLLRNNQKIHSTVTLSSRGEIFKLLNR
ncbi:S1C family serine protease [Akkermansiaceae bacterium]|nr:S1C family serine protease [Akkermansiaceae bacterium]